MRKVLLILFLCLGWASTALALPDRPTVVQGSVQTSLPLTNVMQILQSSPQAIINWNAFNIGPQEVVRFLQPGPMSTLLNRVTGADPSYLQGLLQANGRIFLINPNGILFGPGSVVDVGSFMASTLSLSDADFMAGKYNLIQAPDKALAAIVNQGTLKVADGGFLVLASPLLHNDGLIVARGGQVSLGATGQATFFVDGQGLLQFAVSDGFNRQFSGGSQGGTVLLTQGQVSDLLSQVVANPGIIEAGSLRPGPTRGTTAALGAEGLLINSGTIQVDGNPGQKAGTILLNSSQATVLPPSSLLSANASEANAGEIRVLSAGLTLSAGRLQARADGSGDGGFIEVSGQRLGMSSGADLSAARGRPGQLLLDPINLTIVDGAPNAGDLDYALPTILNATTNATDTVSTGAIAGVTGTVRLDASNQIVYTGVGLAAPNGDLVVSAGNDILFNTPSITAHSLQLNAGRDVSLASGGQLDLTTTAGELRVTAGGNVSSISGLAQSWTSAGNLSVVGASVNITGDTLTMSASRDLTVSSTAGPVDLSGQTTALTSDTGKILVQASGGSAQILSAGGQPLNLTSVQGAVVNASTNTSLSGGPVTVQGNLRLGGQNVSVLTDSWDGGNLTVHAGQNVDFFPGPTAVNALTVTAGNDITLTAFPLQVNGELGINGGGTLQAYIDSLNATGNLSLQSPAVFLTGGAVSISSGNNTLINATQGNLQIDATTMNVVSSTGNVTLNASGDVLMNLGGGPSNLAGLGPGSQVLVSAGNNILQTTPSGFTTNLMLAGASATFQAGRNLDMNLYSLQHAPEGPYAVGLSPNLTLSAGGNLSLVSEGPLPIEAHSISMNAGNDLTLNSSPDLTLTVTSTGGDIRLNANGGLSTASGNHSWTSAGNIMLQGRSVKVHATQELGPNHQIFFYTPQGGIAMNATAGNVLVNGSGQVNLNAQGGALILNATGGDVRVQTVEGDRHLALLGSQVQIGASGNVVLSNNVTGPGPYGIVLAFTQADIQAGQDIVVNATIVSSGNLTAHAGQDLLVTSPLGRIRTSVTNSSLSAGRDLTYGPAGTSTNITSNADGEALFTAGRDLTTPSNLTRLNAGGNLTMAAGHDLNLAPPQTLVLNATSVSLSSNGTVEFPVALTLTTLNNLTLQGAGTLDVTSVNLATPGNLSLSAGNQLLVNQLSAPNVDLSGGNIVISSFQNVTGGNYTITTPGNLSERIATTNITAPQLGSLNVSASQIFGTGNLHSFSIPSTTGALTVRVSGGNDTSYQAAASVARLQGANLMLVTAPTTGDIYVDGILAYQGKAPIPTGAAPPTALTDRSQLSDAQEAELTGALAQSNLALGNLGSFSRVLSAVERDRLTLRNESLTSTSAMLDPYSPTLALVLGWGHEIEALPAALGDELREQDRASFNAMVDLEVREIWEVRYWRRLLEGFIIWEDAGE